MVKKKQVVPKPTDVELEILSVLWRQGPSTVRQVHKELEPTRGTGYTTVLKLMQIMAEKGLLDRDASQRSHVYSAAESAQNTQQQLLRDLMSRAFQGSIGQLVLQALSSKPTTAEELAEIREMLDALQENEK